MALTTSVGSKVGQSVPVFRHIDRLDSVFFLNKCVVEIWCDSGFGRFCMFIRFESFDLV